MNEISEKIQTLYQHQLNYKNSSVKFRIELLKKLKKEIQVQRNNIYAALKKDFNKPQVESELTEIHIAIEEINFAIDHISSWIEPQKVPTPLTLFGSSSYILPEAKGVALIISPWNYPFYLSISPLISAIAAGCSVLLKPSEKTLATSEVIKKIIEKVFEQNHVQIVLGDVTVAQELLKQKFDHIFFTGSPQVGKIVMRQASEHLTSVTLELGGKSPVIIDEKTNLEKSLRSIIWGKFVNAGQTCVAPDYLFVHENFKSDLKNLFNKITQEYYYANGVLDSENMASIIDEKNFNRLNSLISEASLNKYSLNEFNFEKKIIEPMLVELSDVNVPLMQEEIFGPIIPVIYFQNIDTVVNYINSHEKPLALYMYSNNAKKIDLVKRNTSSGAFVVNQVLVHLANPYLPFGGIGNSGLGASHGYYGFREFTHFKSIYKESSFSFFKFLFPPYNKPRLKSFLKILKLIE